MRRRHRSDANQAIIVDVLRKAGCAVWIIERPVDLLIYSHRYGYFLADVKNPDGRGKVLTEAQEKFKREWPGPWYLLESVDDAIRLITGQEQE